MRVVAVYIAGGVILVYMFWTMRQLKKVKWASCKDCLHYHVLKDLGPCDGCYLHEDLDRPTEFVLDEAYLERQSRSS
jgi:hypothetical protein